MRKWDEGEHEGCGIDSQRAFEKENHMTGKIDPLFANHPDILAIGQQTQRFIEGLRSGQRPTGSNADEWHLFLSQYLDNRATQPNGLTYIAVQIAEALDEWRERAEHAESVLAEQDIIRAVVGGSRE